MSQTTHSIHLTLVSVATIRALHCTVAVLTLFVAGFATGADSDSADGEFERTILPVLRQYCTQCHSTKQKEGELDLEPFTTSQIAAGQPKIWERVLEQLADSEMPPKDEPQLPVALKAKFTSGLQKLLDQVALASAGDPGDVVLRRLSNMEYTYTLRDLTGVVSLDPAKEFPVDGAAGEGFTNTGAALVMSPALLTKYLDAAKSVADHALLLPDGMRFSATTSRRDWTNESLIRIREFYRRFTVTVDEKVEVGGTGLVSNDGGRIPLEKYLAATEEYRTALAEGTKTIASVARQRDLNAKYLGLLWAMLHDKKPSLLFDSLRTKWRKGQLTVEDIKQWQQSLWRFTNIGHIGKTGGPKAWMEPVTPLVPQQEFRLKLAAPADGQDVTIYLSAGDAGDGNEHDFALWENARIISPGRPDLSLKDMRSVIRQLVKRRESVASTAPQCLAAAHEAQVSKKPIELATLAEKHDVDPNLLADWMAYLGITATLPGQSLLAQWRRTTSADDRSRLALQVQQLLQQDFASIAADSPDRTTHAQLLSYTGPLLSSVLRSLKVENDDGSESRYGIDPALLGKHPDGHDVAATSLCVRAPSLIEIRLPASLVNGAEFVVQGQLHPTCGDEGSVQLQALTSKPTATRLRPISYNSEILNGAWNSSKPSMAFDAPVLVHDDSTARRRFETAFHDFRQLFPAALCYATIVPVDEVVTLTLFHREDEPLMRLMLDGRQCTTLDRLWAELHFVSQDALTLVDAFEQIWQYSTQDGPDAPNGDKRLEPLREPIMRGAEAFRMQRVAVEPVQVQAVVDFAARAWRRPITEPEQQALRDLYQTLRTKGIAHEAAVRLLLARVLTSPSFLYRGERAGLDAKAAPVSDWELATRLSYFLWASAPDEELRRLAALGKLHNHDVLADQTHRMLQDRKVRRLATEFGCQWLHIRDLETLNEKSERHFPTFVALRGDMQEEAVRFLMDMFQADRSVLSLLDADHSFMNAALARHYEIDLQGDDWQRVDGLQARGRGGMLGFAATLAKQSGASRTSPILRGNWISEVVLGEKLPLPPKDVPILPDEAPQGLTERQLIERHSSDAKCAHCHDRIDHFGFALEGFDAIGRARSQDAAGLPIDTLAKLPGGGELNGLDGLRSYLLEQRRDDFLRQFCRKLLGYALGRGVQLSDKPLLDDMLVQLKSHDFRVGTAIQRIVRSPQFREIRGRKFVSGN